MSQLTITKRVEFDAGHRVAGHGGKCRNPHGHRYVVEATIVGAMADDGMILDFALVGRALRAITDEWDHAFLLDHADKELADLLDGHDWRVVPLPGPPTAEILALVIGRRMTAAMADFAMTVSEVIVRETPTSWATWCP